jgi:hypothetical protein
VIVYKEVENILTRKFVGVHCSHCKKTRSCISSSRKVL